MRTAASTISGATQTPLTDAAQLVPGAILSGIAFNNAWEVVELRGDDVLLRKMQLHTPTACTSHMFSQVGSSTLRACGCGHALERVASLLPLRADTARTLVLQPTGPLVTPDVFTVYVTEQLTIHRVVGATWPVELPIIPKMWPLWSVPEALRDLVRDQLERVAGPATPRR